ncbi:MAG: S-methyl-5-thioribose-1-phosphate isomerase [SAR324 cluster bacterium]|nr:S-methyl-5-thioribose-1-phosphate isomerase [SAR324 cluster bacterium]
MNVNGKPYRTIWLEGDIVKIIHQPFIPHEFEISSLRTHQETATAIQEMWVRGAPAIGAAGVLGMVQAMLHSTPDNYRKFTVDAADLLKNTRPTAQNLFFEIDQVLHCIEQANSWDDACEKVLTQANHSVDTSINACQSIGRFGSELFQDGDSILTHCNAGWLACIDWGTALAPVYYAAREGKQNFIYVDETRPRGQGSRLTAWELGQENIEHAIIADNAAGYYMSRNNIQKVIVGADRIAANGDTANKIGTFTKAVVAFEHGIPFYVAAPISTIDFDCPTGLKIPIEERTPDEVLYTWGMADNGEFLRVRTAPAKSSAKNPAFDVTPAKYITGIITEEGIYQPADLHQLNQ